MNTTVSRLGAAVQSPRGADCAHSRQPFDAAFRVINERRDIGPAAKLVHAHLVTLHRTERDATQADIGEALGMSRHQVWRAVGELVAAGLVQTIRYGLGRPNGYVLLGVDQETLDGKGGRASASRPARRMEAGQSGPRARVTSQEKKRDQERVIGTNANNSIEPSKGAQDFLATRQHDATDYYATRRGRLVRT